jgi:hypothetical protein
MSRKKYAQLKKIVKDWAEPGGKSHQKLGSNGRMRWGRNCR